MGPETLNVPAIRTEVYEQVMKSGDWEDAQARCYGQAVVDTFTLDQLNSDTYIPSPQGQQVLATLRARCR